MAKALLYCQQVRLSLVSAPFPRRQEEREGKGREKMSDKQAMHIQPSDRAILYNIAMIQQKSAELLFSLEPSKRTTEELKVAIDHAQQAVKYVSIFFPPSFLLLPGLSPYTLIIRPLSHQCASLGYTWLRLTYSTFRALAGDKSGALPYDADLADQRARYGDGLLRRAHEQITRQEAYESEAHARVEEVRKLRQAEAERIRAAEVCPLGW